MGNKKKIDNFTHLFLEFECRELTFFMQKLFHKISKICTETIQFELQTCKRNSVNTDENWMILNTAVIVISYHCIARLEIVKNHKE